MTISGVVNANGSIASGSGFSVTRQTTGQYVIDFTQAFSELPAIVGSQTQFGNIGQNTRDNVVFPFVSNGSATALTGDSNGSHTDRSFSFIAIGA